jgi:hypothetical protein
LKIQSSALEKVILYGDGYWIIESGNQQNPAKMRFPVIDNTRQKFILLGNHKEN